MDRSTAQRTLRQINGRTRLTVDLSEPLGLLEDLSNRFEIRFDEVEGDIQGNGNGFLALSNNIDRLDDRIDNISLTPVPQGPQGP